MTHGHAKKQPRAPAKRKIIGKLSKVTAKQIALQTSKGVVWKIDVMPNTKVKGTLRRGFTVTVEFSKKNGQQIPQMRPFRPGKLGKVMGKRTEQSGTVIGLTTQQITLDNAPGPWIISRTDPNTNVISGTLVLGATNVKIDFNLPPGQQVNA
ncbi:MAG TPA: hypothetical protein VFQ78_05360 [Candidatus Udaeobacter sp.]|jgi:hypothetical protein|nr:hypothetical protein [Candidatus Udaeobacter sp.]